MSETALIVIGVGLTMMSAHSNAKEARQRADAEALALMQNAHVARVNSAIIMHQAAFTKQLGFANAALLESSARFNEMIGQFNASFAKQRAGVEASRQRRFTERLLASQRAKFAKSGVNPDVGTPLLVQADSAAESELDAQILEHAGDVEAFNEIVRSRFVAADLRNQGSIARFAAESEASLLGQRAGVELTQAGHLTDLAVSTRRAGRQRARNIMLEGLAKSALTVASSGVTFGA